MTDIQIRRERPDHAQAVGLIAELDRYLASLYAPEHNYLLDVQALMSPEVNFLLAWHGENAVACGATRRMAAEPATDGRPYGEIKRMYVAPSARGRGLGSRVIEALEADLVGRGITLALLETGAEQVEAVRLYARCGYRQRGPFGEYPDNGLSLFLAKELRA